MQHIRLLGLQHAAQTRLAERVPGRGACTVREANYPCVPNLITVPGVRDHGVAVLAEQFLFGKENGVFAAGSGGAVEIMTEEDFHEMVAGVLLSHVRKCLNPGHVGNEILPAVNIANLATNEVC